MEHLHKEQTTYISTQPLKEFDDSHLAKKTPVPVSCQPWVSYTWRFAFKVLQLMAWIPRFFIELDMKPQGICVGGRETLIWRRPTTYK